MTLSAARAFAVDPRTPPLEHGDRLSRDEFFRRWEAMPFLKRAERIGGRVYIESTSRVRRVLGTSDPEIPPLENGDVLQTTDN